MVTGSSNTSSDDAANMAPVAAIILDIGNVICEWNPEKLARSVLTPEQAADVASVEKLIDDTIRHADWASLDRGTMALADAIENAKLRSSFEPSRVEQLYHNTPKSLEPLPVTVAAMHEVKTAGMPLYILSNMQKHAGEYLQKQHEFFALVDHIILSCDCGLLKPEAEIYQHTIKTLGLEAATSVFIDDMKENVEGAIASGLQSIQMTDIHAGGDIIRALLARAST